MPHQGFRPSPGRITEWKPPEGPNIRLDSHCYEGYAVPPYYDSMIGKLIVYGSSRDEALARMGHALARFRVAGIGTTMEFLGYVMTHPDFACGKVNTTLVDRMVEAFATSIQNNDSPERRVP